MLKEMHFIEENDPLKPRAIPVLAALALRSPDGKAPAAQAGEAN